MKTIIWLSLIFFSPLSSFSQIPGSAYKQQLNEYIGNIEGYSMVLSEPYPAITDSVHLNRKPWIGWHEKLLNRYAELVINETFRQIDEWKLSRNPTDTVTSSYREEVSQAVAGLLGFNPVLILSEFQPIDPRNQAQVNQLKKDFEKAFKARFIANGKFTLAEFSESDREFYPVPFYLNRLQSLFETKIVEADPTPVTSPETIQPEVPVSPDSQEVTTPSETETQEVTPPVTETPSEPDPL